MILRTILKRDNTNNASTYKMVLPVLAVLVAVFLITVLFFFIVDKKKIKDDDIVLSVNGEPVTKTEYLFLCQA
jgi:hypothetical protein